MTRTWTVGLVISALAMGALVSGVMQSRAAKSTPDFAGSWTLDRSKSNLPGRGDGFRGRRMGRGGPGERDEIRGAMPPQGSDRGDRGERGLRRRGAGLPPEFRIVQHGDAIRFIDLTGALFQEITVGTVAPRTTAGDGDDPVRRLAGRWADGALEVERTGPRGGTTLQKYTLDDHGHTLEIRMERKGGPERESDGSGPRMGPRGPIKLIYRRTV